MPQKKGEVLEKADATQAVPDVYEDWIEKQVKARSASLAEQAEDKEEDEIDSAEDHHEKAHRRKRGRGAAASGS